MPFLNCKDSEDYKKRLTRAALASMIDMETMLIIINITEPGRFDELTKACKTDADKVHLAALMVLLGRQHMYMDI